MPTSPRRGFNPSRKVGGNPATNALNDYTIASGYAVSLSVGDPVRLTTDGSIIRAANGADAIGIFNGVSYVDTNGNIVFSRTWPASTVATNIVANVIDDPFQTHRVVANSPIPALTVFPGNIYAVDLAAPSTIGRSNMLAVTAPVRTGSLAVVGTNNAALTGLLNGDTFTVRSTVANVPVVITIVTNQTPAQLLALLNAVPGINATLNGSNFLVLTTTDGGNLVLVDGTGTPLTDSALIGAAGTVTAVVAAGAGMVKVVSVVDRATRELEVVLVNHSLRDDG